MAKTEVRIIVKRGRHKTQPYSFVIDNPGKGPEESVQERYTERTKCIRGALRKIGAWKGTVKGPHYVTRRVRGTEKVYPVTIIG
jgi:hypothetical protein